METNICPKTWMTESILVALFCCLPLGIVGIINASKVSSLFAQGQFNEAQQASNKAKKWAKIGFFAGLVFFIIYVTLFFLPLHEIY